MHNSFQRSNYAKILAARLTEWKTRRFPALLLYFTIQVASAFYFFELHHRHRLAPHQDGAQILYLITVNMQRLENWDFSEWTNRLILYPNQNTLAYADHFYLHSLIGLPYYIFTHDPLYTYNFIFFIQLVIAFSGFYFLARKVTTNIVAILLGGLYFCYLPAFIDKHPQINFYGFYPWLVFFLIQFLEKKDVKYLYLFSFAYLLQSLVGIYHQIFVAIFSLILLFIVVIYGAKTNALKQLLHWRVLLPPIVAFAIVGAVLLLVNLPYIEFKKTVGAVRSLATLRERAPDLLSFFTPTSGLLSKPLNYQDRLHFLGFAGIIVLALSLLSAMLIPARRILVILNNRYVLFLCLFFILISWLIALGPELKMSDRMTGIKLPFYYLYKLHFIFRTMRTSGRMIVLMALPLSLLIVWWYDEIKARKLPSFLNVVLLAFFILLLMRDLHRDWKPPSYSSVYDRSYIYARVNETPGRVLLELPSGSICGNLRIAKPCNGGRDAHYQFLHIFHKKWIVNGFSHVPGIQRHIIPEVDMNYDNLPALRKILSENRVSLILIHRYRIDQSHLDEFRIFIDKLLSIFEIAKIDHNYVFLRGFFNTEDPTPQEGLRKRRLSFEKRWQKTMVQPGRRPQSGIITW